VAGSTFAIATCSLFFQPVITASSPVFHRFVADLRNVGRVGLLLLTNLRVHQVGTLEEFRFCRTRHEIK